MQGGDYLSPVTDRCRHAFDRTGTHVADRKDPRHAAFEWTLDIAAGVNKALLVECDAGAGQPVGVRVRADEQEQVTDRARSFLARPMRAAADRFENAFLPIECDH